MSGPEISLVDNQGQLQKVPEADATSFIADGWRAPTADEIRLHREKEEFGGVGSEIKAGLAGAARGATLGISDQVITRVGWAEPETLKSLEEQNPKSSVGGEIVGTVVPMLVGDEAGVANLPKLIGKLGKGAERLIARGVEREGMGLAKKIGVKALEKAAGGAVEGAAFSAGHVISEQALGDPNLTAETAMHEIGLGALLGAGAGGFAGAFEVAVPEAVKASKRLSGKLLGTIDEVYSTRVGPALTGESTATLGKLKEAIAADAPDKEKMIRSFASDLNEQYRAQLKATRGFYEEIHADEMAGLLQGADIKAANQQLAATRSELDDLVAKMKAEPELYPPQYARKLELQVEALERDLPRARVEMSPTGPRDATGRRRMVEVTKPLEHSPAEIFASLDDLKGNIDSNIKYGTIPGAADLDAQAQIKGFRSNIKSALENEATWGQAGARQAEINSAVSEHQGILKEFRKNFMDKTTTKSGGVAYEVSGRKVGTYLKQLNKASGDAREDLLERYLQSSAKQADTWEKGYQALGVENTDREALTSLLERAKKQNLDLKQQAEVDDLLKKFGAGPADSSLRTGLEIAAGGVGLGHVLGMSGLAPVSSVIGLAKIMGAARSYAENPFRVYSTLLALEKAGQKMSQAIDTGTRALVGGVQLAVPVLRGPLGASGARSFEARMDRIASLSANPEAMAEQLERSTSHLNAQAPTIAALTKVKKTKAIAFLQSKLPKMSMTGIKPIKVKPSPAELSKFNKYYQAVSKPLSILEQARSGLLTQETVEAVSTVYPDLFAKIQQDLLEKVAESRKPLRYDQKLPISMILGQPVDDTVDPKWLAMRQAVYSSAPQAQAPKATPARADKLTVAERILTPAQASANRA